MICSSVWQWDLAAGTCYCWPFKLLTALGLCCKTSHLPQLTFTVVKSLLLIGPFATSKFCICLSLALLTDSCDVTVAGREVICFSASLNGFQQNILSTDTNGMGYIEATSFPTLFLSRLHGLSHEDESRCP